MSGELISTLSGKVPQRAIRYLSQLPYCVSYKSEAVVDFGNTGDDIIFEFATPSTLRGKVLQIDSLANGEIFRGDTKGAEVAVGTADALSDICITDEFAASTAEQTFSAHDGSLIDGATPIIEPGDNVFVSGIDATGTPTGQSYVGVTVFYFE